MKINEGFQKSKETGGDIDEICPNKSKLDWSVYESFFGTWASRIYPFFREGKFDKIAEFLSNEKSRGKRTAPLSQDIFRIFQLCSYREIKCAVIGICPYHSLKNNRIVADGLALSCGKTQFLQPSLVNFYDSLEYEFGEKSERSPDLEFLAKQGTFLFNLALSTEIGKVFSHGEIWNEFAIHIFGLLAISGVPVVLLGKETHKFQRFLAPMQWVFPISHPASISYNSTGELWNIGNDTFKKVNKILLDNNKESINWLNKPDDKPFDYLDLPF